MHIRFVVGAVDIDIDGGRVASIAQNLKPVGRVCIVHIVRSGTGLHDIEFGIRAGNDFVRTFAAVNRVVTAEPLDQVMRATTIQFVVTTGTVYGAPRSGLDPVEIRQREGIARRKRPRGHAPLTGDRVSDCHELGQVCRHRENRATQQEHILPPSVEILDQHDLGCAVLGRDLFDAEIAVIRNRLAVNRAAKNTGIIDFHRSVVRIGSGISVREGRNCTAQPDDFKRCRLKTGRHIVLVPNDTQARCNVRSRQGDFLRKAI